MTRKTLTLLILLCLVLGAQLWAAGSEKEEDTGDPAHTHYNKGVDLMQKGDYAAAQTHFEKALKVKEAFAEAHNNLAYSLRRQGEGNYAAALKHYNRALELKPNLAQALMYRGVLHALKGDEASARKDLEKLNKLDRKLGDQLLQVLASGEEPEGHGGVTAKWE